MLKDLWTPSDKVWQKNAKNQKDHHLVFDKQVIKNGG